MANVHIDLAGNFEDGVKRAGGSWSMFVTGLNQGLELITSVGGFAFRTLDDLLNTADGFGDLRDGLESFAGSGRAADSMLNAVQSSTKGLVTEMEAMEIASIALGRGVVTNAEQMGELANAGAILGSRYGLDAAQGIEKLTAAMTTGSARALKELGIVVDLDAATLNYARALGVSTTSLTDVQLLEARRLAILEAANEKVGLGAELNLSAAEKLDVLGNSVKDAKTDLAMMVAEGLEPAVTWLLDMSKHAPSAQQMMSGFGEMASTAMDMLREHGEQVDANGVQIYGLTSSLKNAASAFVLSGDAAKEHALAALADAQAAESEQKFIERVNTALGTKFTSLQDAATAARENRDAILKHEEAARAEAEALDEVAVAGADAAEAIADLASEAAAATLTSRELAEELGVSQEALSLLGLTGKDTASAMKATGHAAVEAFEAARSSGVFSAHQLHDAWTKEVVPAIIDAYGELPPEFAAMNDQITSELEAEMPGSVQKWLDSAKTAIEADGGMLGEPVAAAIGEGFNKHLEYMEPGLVTWGYMIGKEAAGEFVHYLNSTEGQIELSNILGDLVGPKSVKKGGGPDADFLKGPGPAALSEDVQAELKALYDKQQSDRAKTGVEAAINAYDEDNPEWLQGMVNALRANLKNMSRHFKMTPATRDVMDQIGEQIRAIIMAGDLLGLPIAAQGGLVNVPTSGGLAVLHGQEAVIPLSEGGDRVARAVLGEEGMTALTRIADATERNVAIAGELLGVQVGVAQRGLEHGAAYDELGRIGKAGKSFGLHSVGSGAGHPNGTLRRT